VFAGIEAAVMRRAHIEAIAEAVVASFWDVEDLTDGE
jgi:hypothetical protein